MTGSPLWLEEECEPIRSSIFSGTADVAIVGGGVTGCATALRLADAGRRVRLYEAREIAGGASGRNGGFALRGGAMDTTTRFATTAPPPLTSSGCARSTRFTPSVSLPEMPFARLLADEGVSVVVHGRDRGRAEEVASDVVAKGSEAAVVLGEVTDDHGADTVAAAALEAFDGIDILVNCAGGVVRMDNRDWLQVSTAEWFASFDLNVVSAFRLAARLAPDMIEAGWGRIINVSSVAGSQWNGVQHEYGSAKAALDHFTGNLSRTLAPHGITVNAIVSGTVLTPASARWIESLRSTYGWSDDFAENERDYTREFFAQPIPRLGRPEEVAAAVVYLASPWSDFTTGALLRIDGGTVKGR